MVGLGHIYSILDGGVGTYSVYWMLWLGHIQYTGWSKDVIYTVYSLDGGTGKYTVYRMVSGAGTVNQVGFWETSSHDHGLTSYYKTQVLPRVI